MQIDYIMGRNNSNKKNRQRMQFARVKAIANNPHIPNKKKEIVNMTTKTSDRCALNNPEFQERHNQAMVVAEL